jgi:short chain dehydrogenase
VIYPSSARVRLDHNAEAQQVFENYLAYELPGALEVQPQRLLECDPQEPESLQGPRPLQRTNVDSPHAPSRTSCATVALAPSSPARKTASGWPATCPSMSVLEKVVSNALTTLDADGALSANSSAAEVPGTVASPSKVSFRGLAISTITLPANLSPAPWRSQAPRIVHCTLLASRVNRVLPIGIMLASTRRRHRVNEAGRLKDKSALVTGASSGLGGATAFELARAGTDVALVARSAEELESAK